MIKIQEMLIFQKYFHEVIKKNGGVVFLIQHFPTNLNIKKMDTNQISSTSSGP